jgi:hypothetical protein
MNHPPTGRHDQAFIWRIQDQDMPVRWFPRAPALVSGIVSLTIAWMAFVLDGTVLHCNDCAFAICTGISVPWLGLSAVPLDTITLALVTSVLPERLYRHWTTALAVAFSIGCAISCILLLHTGPLTAEPRRPHRPHDRSPCKTSFAEGPVTTARYGHHMDDGEERHNLVMRTEIVSAYIRAVENPEKLFRVCANVSGGRDDERAAVAAEFEVSDVVADAILDLQVRRFTPRSIEQMRNEPADYDRRLAEFDQPEDDP